MKFGDGRFGILRGFLEETRLVGNWAISGQTHKTAAGVRLNVSEVRTLRTMSSGAARYLLRWDVVVIDTANDLVDPDEILLGCVG